MTVITPVYNAEKFILRAVLSVQSQNGVLLEHILVNDGSTDKSLEILRNLSTLYSNVKVIDFKKNLGPIEARNSAVSMARGKYLAFLDVDDYWLPHKLITQTKFMETTGAVISFSDCRFISEDGGLIGRRLMGPMKVGFSLHHMTRFLACLTIMVNKDVCNDFSFPKINPAIRAEDFLAWLYVIEKYGPALRCPHDLARYAVVMNSRSSNPIKASFSVWELYRGVEKIHFLTACGYFLIYVFFVLIKKITMRPRWNSKSIDSDLADFYKV